jgi:DNA-directed RNA polymerase subunit RPC12/RpoP
MIEIKVSTPQPIDCPKCKAKYGYKVVQRIQKYVDNIYDAEGNDNGCIYSDYEKILGQLKTIVCANCNAKLPFKFRE